MNKIQSKPEVNNWRLINIQEVEKYHKFVNILPCTKKRKNSLAYWKHSPEYETSDNDRKVNQNIYQMRIESREEKNNTSDRPQDLANGHPFAHCLVEESKGENELSLFTKNIGHNVLLIWK